MKATAKFAHLVLLFALMILATSHSVAQDNPRRDGNWWRQQTRSEKVVYMVGFFDGMDLGNKFSYWKWWNDPKKESFSSLVNESYSEYNNKYFKNVKAGQLVDGLERFYDDYRNRSLLIDNGVWLVLNEIAGTPRQTLDTMIETWRQNAK